MAQRIALVPCINPAHKDDTPSMAVYDHGKEKLQVFCFGCKYHGWVTPSEVVDTAGKATKTYKTAEQEPTGVHRSLGEVRMAVESFFTDRGFRLSGIPWAHIIYGSDVFGDRIRPYLRWALLDWDNNTIGYQVRFLDEHKPKIKTISVGGKYPSVAWLGASRDRDAGVRIVESWVDAVYINYIFGDKPTLILLGTQPSKVDWYKFIVSIGNKTEVHLYFDGDKAGMECEGKIQHVLTDLGQVVLPHTQKGKKTYELQTN